MEQNIDTNHEKNHHHGTEVEEVSRASRTSTSTSTSADQQHEEERDRKSNRTPSSKKNKRITSVVVVVAAVVLTAAGIATAVVVARNRNKVDTKANETPPPSMAETSDNAAQQTYTGPILHGFGPVVPVVDPSPLIHDDDDFFFKYYDDPTPGCHDFSFDLLWPSTSEENDWPGFRFHQRYGLSVFYCATNGTGWTIHPNHIIDHDPTLLNLTDILWESGLHECDWLANAMAAAEGGDAAQFGDEDYPCDEEGRVTVLRLNNAGLQGSIPTELFALSNLVELNLADNADLSAHIDSRMIASFNNNQLQVINLSGTSGVDFPSIYFDLPQLISLDLSRSGVIPWRLPYRPCSYHQYWGCKEGTSSLQELRLNGNQISGRFPSISDLMTLAPDLRVLDLSDNTIGGPIPPESFVPSPTTSNAPLLLLLLEELYLHGNLLSGTVPTEIGNLEFLKVLTLHSNNPLLLFDGSDIIISQTTCDALPEDIFISVDCDVVHDCECCTCAIP